LNERAELLTANPRQRGFPKLRPVDAATLVLLDDSSSSAKILMGRRNQSLKFMPGKFVFPGGRVDAADRKVDAMGDLSPETHARMTARVVRPTLPRSRALAAAAIRETFEETGYLIGGKGRMERNVPESWQEFADEGYLPALSSPARSRRQAVLAVLIRASSWPPCRPRPFASHARSARRRS
jgi:8-oxo-dGTP pyrophosphatase MutT (NUDIX family)